MTEDKHQQILMNNIYIQRRRRRRTKKNKEMHEYMIFFFSLYTKHFLHLNIAQANEIGIEDSPLLFKDQLYIVVEYLVD